MNRLQLYRAVGTLTRAFRDDPLPRLIAPDPALRTPMMRAVFAYNFAARWRRAGDHFPRPLRGRSGDALGILPDRAERASPHTGRALLIAMSRALDEARLDAAQGQPHIYLSALGVLPGFRGRGSHGAPKYGQIRGGAGKPRGLSGNRRVVQLAYYERGRLVSELSLDGTRCFPHAHTTPWCSDRRSEVPGVGFALAGGSVFARNPRVLKVDHYARSLERRLK